MTEYVYKKAPVYCIEGVPGYKAGEWPGLKSSRFENTRRIIHPKCSGIIFNENEPLPKPRRKLLDPGPSKEFVFRPCVKMVKQDFEKKKTGKFAFELFPAMKEGRKFFQRKCYFEIKNDYYKTVQEKHNKFKLQNMISGKTTNSNIGFNKQFFETVSNNKLLGVTITKEIFNNILSKTTTLPKLNSNEFLKHSKIAWQQRENKKISDLKMEHENLQRDIHYVTLLKENVNDSDED